MQALEDVGYRGCQLKWPNDVLLDNAKLAGILLEISGDLTGDAVVVIGVGVNVLLDSAASIDQAWTSLLRSGQHATLDRNELIAALLRRLAPALDAFHRQGFAPFQQQWMTRNAWAGKAVKVVSGSNELYGVDAGVNARGALLLHTESGDVEISGGEVSLRLNHAS